MLNKGKIIRVGRVNVTEDEVTNVTLLLTSDMLPAFRFVAYYIKSLQYGEEVVADSVLVNVESHCLGSVSQFALESLMRCLLLCHSVQAKNKALRGMLF